MLLLPGNRTCYSSVWSIFPSEVSLVLSLLQFLHIISVKPSLSAQYKISMPLSQYLFPFLKFLKIFSPKPVFDITILYHLLIYFVRCLHSWNRSSMRAGILSVYLLLHPQYPEQCLAPTGYLLNICWMNKGTSEVLDLFFYENRIV